MESKNVYESYVTSKLKRWPSVRVKVSVTGIVQGVGFRPFIYRTAVKNGLNGYVRNRGDAGVEILLEGKKTNVKDFIKDLKLKKPPLARMHEIITKKLEGKEICRNFTIYRSSNEAELSGSVIPPDIAICNECLQELRDPKDPRYEYFFITCTDCGPRFTIIEHLPYDRENTTMREFPMCEFCKSEYADPLNRRFHAQTVACPKCGPKAYLTTRKGELIDHKEPIKEAGKLLSEGFILAIKGYGGFHVATSTTKDKPLAKLREVKHRRQKPFAIMARSLEAAKTFAEVSKREEEFLASYVRPIVLLNKSDAYYLSSLVAPDLHNVGVMLPYTGLHYMLFDGVDEPAFVMTSANPPNQPIVRDNEEALRTLGETVDYFLFHNRQIAHRCDDSVVRMHDTNLAFIRRSRGYAPAPIMLKEKAKRCVVGLGGELNNTACILLDNKAFISQHIGDVENVETREFLKEATKHLIRLTNSKVEAIACDLHPKFTTTKLAHDLAKENAWQLVRVQHHYAHVAALMLEHNVKEMVGVCCDGYGYGVDGEAWGGEILFCTRKESGFKRVAHLEKQPLVGGDLATRYPLRMAAGMLSRKTDLKDWLLQNKQHFPHGEKETQIILDQLEKGYGVVETTSCGRVLDAVAAVLGVCYERTYEGEPAMKLESAAIKGKDVLKLKPTIKGNTLETTQMLLEVFENKEKQSIVNLAYSAHAYLAKGLAILAVEKASENTIKNIGFSGGAACNQILALIMRRAVEAAGLRFLVHEAVPPGDGGLSFGQTVACGFFQC
ncbi:MAG: carbamoyltransferase HypF [Candidatus Bathyarchaeota archaeon]|nr:carbamoyltransferase HypF [Candidatus Bathyarchaeota archaeon]